MYGDQAGALDGFLDDGAGHGTFVAGIIRQVCPEADLISLRVADSNGTVLESEFIDALEELVQRMDGQGPEGAQPVDVVNLSLGYYHETPEDGRFSTRLYEVLKELRSRGCVIVCSAGNDATDRPTFPAALWTWNDPELQLVEPEGLAEHISVGALNPNNASVALYSNVGDWVRAYAPGTSVLSTIPPLQGGVQAGSRARHVRPAARDDRPRRLHGRLRHLERHVVRGTLRRGPHRPGPGSRPHGGRRQRCGEPERRDRVGARRCASPGTRRR